jgi:hypothetical protein
MKTILSTLFLFLVFSAAHGSLYSYPEDKRPTISLEEACKIATRMLKTQGDQDRYYVIEVILLGDEKGTGVGAWNLMHYDRKGNRVQAYIPFPKGKPALHYYPHDYDKRGGDREVEFDAVPK